MLTYCESLLHSFVLILVVLVGRLDEVYSDDRVLVAGLEVLHFLVGDQSFVRLLALLVKNAQVVPDFRHQGVQRCGLDDVFEAVAVIAVLVVNDGESGPIGSFAWVLEGGLLEKFERLLEVIFGHVASALDVQGVSLVWLQLLDVFGVFQGLVVISF